MRDAALDALRVGCVKYLNARPLVHGWPGRVVFDHPAALCAQLAQGDLDVALVSSFELFLRPEFLVVDGVAIASHGAVYSVIVVSERPFEEVHTIALDPASVTSVNLLRCLAAERCVPTRLVAVGPADAQLLIGDQALRFRAKATPSHQIVDLGAWWRSATGLPFVYALWLVRPDCSAARAVAAELRRLAELNMTRLDALAAAEHEFNADFCNRYWRDHLRFHLGEREKVGLTRFRSLCEKHGILSSRIAEPRFI